MLEGVKSIHAGASQMFLLTFKQYRLKLYMLMKPRVKAAL